MALAEQHSSERLSTTRAPLCWWAVLLVPARSFCEPQSWRSFCALCVPCSVLPCGPHGYLSSLPRRLALPPSCSPCCRRSRCIRTLPPAPGSHAHSCTHTHMHARVSGFSRLTRRAAEAGVVWTKKAIPSKQRKASTSTGSAHIEKPAAQLDKDRCCFSRVRSTRRRMSSGVASHSEPRRFRPLPTPSL